MSDSLSALAQEPSPVVDDDVEMTDTTKTAFSRFGNSKEKPRRRRQGAYGSSVLEDTDKDSPSVLGNVLNSSDLLVDDDMLLSQPSDSLFHEEKDDFSDNDNDASLAGDNDEENGNVAADKDDDSSDEEESDDDATVAMGQPEEEQVSRGRKKRAFRPAPEIHDGETPAAPTEKDMEQETANDEAPTEEYMPTKKEVEPAADDTKVTNKDETQVNDSMAKQEEKKQPDEESLITSIDNLFVHVSDKNTVTIRDIIRSLEEEYNVKITKPTKAIVKSRLVDLINGRVEPTVEEPEQPASESEEEQMDEESDAGEALDSESSDEEEEVKRAPKKRPKKHRKSSNPSKRTSSRQKPASKKPSHVRVHAEMLRKRRIEELRVRNEELQVKQNKEDQQRAEQIARKFETDTDELRLKRLEDRLDLLQKLDQKRIRIVSDETALKEEKKMETAAAPKDPQVPSLASTEESDSDDDDFELEIVRKDDSSSINERLTKVSFSSGPPVVAKSLAISVLDMVRNLKPTDKKPKSTGVMLGLTANQPQASPGKSMTARAALRSRLRAKQRKGANMWLARELGYKTQEEHLRDCMLVGQKKRDDVVKREEERLRANERKLLRERMLMESSPYEEAEEEEYNPNEPENAGENNDDDGDESDEEMAMAREIEEEINAGVSPEESPVVRSLPESTEDDGVPPVEDETEPHVDEEVDESMQEQQKKSAPSMETSLEAATSDVETNVDEVDNVDDELVSDQELGVEATHEDIAAPSSDEVNAESNGDEAKTEMADSDDDHSPSDDVTNDEDENIFEEDSVSAKSDTKEAVEIKAPKDRNAGWKAMLQKEAEKLKKEKARRKVNDLVEVEADEEEEEEVAGLEDFGFSFGKKKKDDDEEDIDDDKLTAEDMKHVVDDVSDDEGDEEAGEAARKELEQKEEKERHKDIIRRMREGYDGRRGGIAGAGVGARGMHRFDQLVAADNRQDAKRLGLLNDDELDSDDDEGQGDGKVNDSDEDENALLDKMLKDRFLHRSSVDEVEENFSSDDEEEEEVNEEKNKQAIDDDEKEQERLAKRFAKRARMQRLIETHGHDEEFSQLRLIDEDETTRLELKMMKSVSRKTRDVSTTSSSGSASQSGGSDSRGVAPVFGVKKPSTSLALGTSSLSLALQASRASKKKKTSFLGGAGASKEMSSSVHKCVSMGHVVFNTGDSQLSKGGQSGRSNMRNLAHSKGKRKRSSMQNSTSLWSKVSANGFKKRRS